VLKKIIAATALVAALTGGAAQASTFDFSYTFTDGLAITGTLDGTLNGALVSGISNVNVTFNGIAFSGPLFAGSFNSATSSYDYSSGAAVVSTNAALNNFIFADSNDPAGNNVTNYFYFLNGASPSDQQVFAANGNVLTNNADFDGPAVGTWSLTPVPLPAALPLLLSGLSLFGIKRRRSRLEAAHA
jgi:hypothetical protein